MSIPSVNTEPFKLSQASENKHPLGKLRALHFPLLKHIFKFMPTHDLAQAALLNSTVNSMIEGPFDLSLQAISQLYADLIKREPRGGKKEIRFENYFVGGTTLDLREGLYPIPRCLKSPGSVALHSHILKDSKAVLFHPLSNSMFAYLCHAASRVKELKLDIGRIFTSENKNERVEALNRALCLNRELGHIVLYVDQAAEAMLGVNVYGDLEVLLKNVKVDSLSLVFNTPHYLKWYHAVSNALGVVERSLKAFSLDASWTLYEPSSLNTMIQTLERFDLKKLTLIGLLNPENSTSFLPSLNALQSLEYLKLRMSKIRLDFSQMLLPNLKEIYLRTNQPDLEAAYSGWQNLALATRIEAFTLSNSHLFFSIESDLFMTGLQDRVVSIDLSDTPFPLTQCLETVFITPGATWNALKIFKASINSLPSDAEMDLSHFSYPQFPSLTHLTLSSIGNSVRIKAESLRVFFERPETTCKLEEMHLQGLNIAFTKDTADSLLNADMPRLEVLNWSWNSREFPIPYFTNRETNSREGVSFMARLARGIQGGKLPLLRELSLNAPGLNVSPEWSHPVMEAAGFEWLLKANPEEWSLSAIKNLIQQNKSKILIDYAPYVGLPSAVSEPFDLTKETWLCPHYYYRKPYFKAVP